MDFSLANARADAIRIPVQMREERWKAPFDGVRAGRCLDSAPAAWCLPGMESGPRRPVRDGASGRETSFPAPVRSELISYSSMRLDR